MRIPARGQLKVQSFREPLNTGATMSIAVLNQVYDEVRRLSIAGSNLAAGDFRLKKLVEPLQKSAQKAPVFGKVAEAIEKVLASNHKTSADSLLDLATLTSAILYTQGETGAEGPLEPINSQNLGLMVSNNSARVLKPLIEALTTIGSGRLEIIREAHERGVFKDLRLIKHAIAAINDKNGEIGEFIAEKILPMYGKAIYPEILAGYDPSGKGDDAFRLKLLHHLDPESTKSLVDAALESGSKDVRIAAISCLQGREDCVPFLLQQAKARAQDIRALALRNMATIDHPEVISVLQAALSGADVRWVARFVSGNRNASFQAWIIDEATRQRDLLLSGTLKKQATTANTTPAAKGKAKAKAAGDTPDEATAIERFNELLNAFVGRKDKPAVRFLLDCNALHEEFLKLKTGCGGDRINSHIAMMMLVCEATETHTQLAQLGANVHHESVPYTFLASSIVESPQKAWERFSAAYLNRPNDKTKDAEEAGPVSVQLSEILTEIHKAKDSTHGHHNDDEMLASYYLTAELDPRWLEAALQIKDKDVILTLATKPHPGVQAFLTEYVDNELRKTTWNPGYSLDSVFETMIRIQHPDLVTKLIQVLELACHAAQQYWWAYYLIRLIPRMPESAIAPLEALIPKIREQLQDSFVGFLDELRQKHQKK